MATLNLNNTTATKTDESNPFNLGPFPESYVAGVRFHALSLEESLNAIEGFIQTKRPHQISFSNAYTVTLCHHYPDLLKIINNSHLTLPDGMSIVWGSIKTGARIRERVAGPDLMDELCGRAAKKGYGVYLMGTSPENLKRLSQSLQTKWPGLNIVGTHSPPMAAQISDDETQIIVKKLRETNPEILFVGVSCPKQERWIHDNLQKINVPVCLGVGAAFDFLSGKCPRAPESLRKIGLEWLHRLYCEPRRLWKRYLLGNLVFGYLIWRHIFIRKFFKSKEKPNA